MATEKRKSGMQQSITLPTDDGMGDEIRHLREDEKRMHIKKDLTHCI